MFTRPWRLAWRPLRTPIAYGASRCLAVLCLGAAALGVHAAADTPLSLDQALRLSEERSRQLVAQGSAASAAREMAVAAGQRPDPVLRAGINNLPINGPDRFSLTRDFMTMRSVGVMQELTRGDKLRARAARFDREAQVAEAGRELDLANLQRDTATAWLDRHYQERIRQVLVQQRDEARLQVQAADAAYRGGRGTQADAFAARSAVAQIEDRIAQAERQIAVATTQLARWVGPLAAAQPLAVPPDTTAVRLDLSNLESVLGHHPRIAVMARQEEVALAEAEVARTSRQADWSAEVMYSQRGPAYSNMVSLNVSVPLQWDRKNRQDRELAARLATVQRLAAEREEATRAHVAEALGLLKEWQSDRERLLRYDDALIPLASARVRAATVAYGGNTGTLSAALEARRSEIDVRVERLRLEMDAARLWAQLNYLVPGGHEPSATHP